MTPNLIRRSRRVWPWLLVLAAVALAIRAVQSWQTRAQPPASKTASRPQIAVAVATAHQGNMPVYLDGLGSVTAYYTVTVRTRVDGQLMGVYFREGQNVRQDELLAEIDPRPFQVLLEQAQGQMARDQALLANARLDLERYRVLLAQDAIPRQQLDTQVALAGQYEGNVKMDQAAIDNARLQLAYCRITAPIGGRIGLRLVDPGNIVHASDANGLLVVTQLQPITVVFTLPEAGLFPVLKKLRAGVNLAVDAYNRDGTQKLASGRLLSTDNQIDPNTGTIRLKGVFQNRESTLFPNQFVNVRLLVDVLRNQVIVPSVAVQRGSQGTYVYVVKSDNTAELRPVAVSITEGNQASIEKGLTAGERVVIDGFDKLQPGSRVAMRSEAGASGAGSAPAGKGSK